MSTVTTSRAGPATARRPLDRSRLAFALLAGTLAWAGREFSGRTLWFTWGVGQVRGSHVLLAGVLALTLPAVLRARGPSVERRLSHVELRSWALAAAVIVALHAAWAMHTGAIFPFADWHNLVFLAAATWAVARWLSVQPWRRLALLDFSLVIGAATLWPLVNWMAGGGDTLFGVRTPLFSGPHLMVAVFAALVTGGAWLAGVRTSSTLYNLAVILAFFSTSLLVLLSFRRSYWLMLTLGLLLLLGIQILQRRAVPERVFRIAGAGLLVVGVTVSVLGWEAVVKRLDSFVPTSESQFARTNQDHINDILDAFDVIAENPVLGYGTGQPYETNRIWQWKATAFEVHSAPVHVWLKWGIFGLIIYLGFHLRWLTAMARLGRSGRRREDVLFSAAAVFLAVELLDSVFTTWVYGSFHLVVHRAVLLGAFLAVADLLPSRR